MSKRRWTKTALAISASLFVVWWILGTSATLAWFTDTTSTVRNEFKIGQMDLAVSFKNDRITQWTDLEGSSVVFNDHALYEPGYTQVVYMKIENVGEVDFDYKMSVTVKGVTKSFSVLGNEIYLPNYLKYGAVFATSEIELERKLAQGIADVYMLDTWSKVSDYTLAAGDGPHYAALIVYMPEEVGNAANYRWTEAPKVELGITIFAQQAGTDLQ